ncbi:MAG: phosphoribosylformylglycinamidine cyclo-ligase [candidate division WOR-3 bacterium]
MLYREAGVNIDALDTVKRRIARLCRSTYTPRVLSEVGLFGSLFRMPGMRDPVLVASCDGVGTKTVIARMLHRYDTIGIDIVNHSVNDILTLGASPLFFLDYVAGATLPHPALLDIVRGLARACRDNGCALVGGETAMMPGVYRRGELDLAGFIVGAVERNRILDGRQLNPGDVAIGLPSSGLHTNGYSLARKVLFESAHLKPGSRIPGLRLPLGLELLRPHRSYLRTVRPVLTDVKAIAHITGGGFYDNIRRLLPADVSCLIDTKCWRPSAVFRLIQRLGSVPRTEMYRVFNMGIGMVLFVAPRKAREVQNAVRGSRIIGRLVRGTFGVALP